MKISGSGSIEGKIDDEIIVSGSGHLKGDLECNGLRASGSLRGAGSVLSHANGSLQGDNDAKFSGTATIGREVAIQGYLTSSGSFHAGGNVTGNLGIKSSGTAIVSGHLISEKLIDLRGSGKIRGNVKGEDILFDSKNEKIKIKKFWFRVKGSVEADNKIELVNTQVSKNVVGRDVYLGKGTAVLGTVSYVGNLEVDKRATLANDPVKISEEDLKIIRKGD